MEHEIETKDVLALSNEELAERTGTEVEPAPKPRKRSKRAAKAKAKAKPRNKAKRVARQVATISHQRLAGLKAARTKLIGKRHGTRGKVRAELAAKIDQLTAEIESAVVDEQSLVLASIAALSAHRTRVEARMPGTRGKARAAMKSLVANYNEKIAELAA